MVKERHFLTLKNITMATFTYTGTEGGSFVSTPNLNNATFFDYDRSTIERLLISPISQLTSVGIRFHFDSERPTPPSDLFAIGVTGGSLVQEIFTPTGKDYKAAKGSDLNRAEFSNVIPNQTAAKSGTCVYISRMALENELAKTRNGQPSDGIRLFVVPFEFPGTTDLSSLAITAILNGEPTTSTTSILRSDMPCPPNCGTDY